MRDLKILFFVFVLFVQTCLSEKVETTKHGHNTDGKDKKVSKRDYYAPEYNHDKHNSYPAYRFEYGVHDPQTGDIKKQYEERDGDTVRGYYSLMEPDGSIRLVEYTADSKNGFQAIVKKMGHSHHPTSVTYHMNTAAGGLHDGNDGGGGGGSYAPNYHGGDHYDHHQQTFAPVYGDNSGHHYQQPAANHYEPPPPAYNSHYEPPAYNGHYEPPAYNGHYEPPHNFDNHYYLQQQQQQPPPSAYNHYEPPPVSAHNHYEPPPVSAHNHYEPPPVSAHNHYQQPPVSAYGDDHYDPPAVQPVHGHYERPAHNPLHYGPPVAASPETADFEHGSQPLYAGALPNAHGDYGSASPEEYYPAPLQFPAASQEDNFDWSLRDDDHQRLHRIDLDGFQLPAANGDAAAGPAKGGSAERPEYLRKYFDSDYRGNAAVSSFYEDDDDQSK